MALTINIHEAKTHLSELLQRVLQGEEIIIAKAGKPIACLTPYRQKPTTRIPGIDAGKIQISADFDAPLDDFDDL
jgi:prevent-host-death family protein